MREFWSVWIGAFIGGVILGASVMTVALDDDKPDGTPVVIIQESDGSFGVQRI